MTVFNNKLVIGVSDGIHGKELWYYDGVDTMKPADRKGTASGLLDFYANPEYNFIVVDNTLYYTSHDSTLSKFDRELCMWDGSTGPKLRKNLNKIGSTGPMGYSTLNNKLYFGGDGDSATQGSHAAQFFEYNPATDTYKCFYPKNVTKTNQTEKIEQTIVYKNKVYFCAGSRVHASLYAFDPLTDTIQIIGDTANSKPMTDMVVYNDTMYFIGFDSTHGIELYSYDGIDTPKRLTDILTGDEHSIRAVDGHNNSLMAYNNKLYFTVYAGQINMEMKLVMHSYDILTGQVSRVSGFDTFTTANDPQFLTVYNNYMFLKIAKNLYRYNGSKIDTILPSGLNPMLVHEYNGNLYMMATTPQFGFELYRFIDSTVSVETTQRIHNLTFYPNPTTNTAHIAMNLTHTETLQVTVTDVSGKAVYKTRPALYSTGKSEIELPLTALSPGTYILSLSGTRGKILWSGKLLKQ
ncbi:MAG TPA: T9SS type A sorting domain-containing protein [Flavipsychrobacter sp.]